MSSDAAAAIKRGDYELRAARAPETVSKGSFVRQASSRLDLILAHTETERENVDREELQANSKLTETNLHRPYTKPQCPAAGSASAGPPIQDKI